MYKIHCSSVGTYHPDPKAEIAWTINDTRGSIDGGPACDECNACDCDQDAMEPGDHETVCTGLSYAFVCLDGGESLCEACAAKAGIEIVDCDCE